MAMIDPQVLTLTEKLRSDLKKILDGHPDLKTAFHLSPQNVSTLIAVATDNSKRGNFDEAYALLGGLRAADPDNAEVHAAIGSVLAAQGVYETARQELEYAVHLNPTCASARLKLGELALQQGNIPAAIQQLKAATEHSTSDTTSAARARALLLLISDIVKDLQKKGPRP